MEKFIVYTDGGARGNPGPAAIGVVVLDPSGHEHTISTYIGKTTNNCAEYEAVIAAFQYLLKVITPESTEIHMYLDSQLVVRQLKGLYKVKDNHLREKYYTVKSLELKLGIPIIYNEVPREKNSRADYLVNKALDRERYI